jgi:CheY-like chemotaxis protein
MSEIFELHPTQAMLEGLLRDALVHLYDTSQLQTHPLTRLLAQAPNPDGRKALTLHRMVLEALERLRPPAHVNPGDPAWRPYAALHLRYVEGSDLAEVAEELGVSLRQLRREHARGLRALTLVIWDDFLTAPQRRSLAHSAAGMAAPVDAAPQTVLPDLEPDLPPQADLAHAPVAEGVDAVLARELARLGTGAPRQGGTSLPMALEGVADTLTDLLARQAVELVIDLDDATPTIRMDRVVLRQILLNLLIHLLTQSAAGEIAIRAQAAAQRATTLDAGVLEVTVAYPGVVGPQPQRDDRLRIVEQLLHLQGGQLIWEAGACCRLRLPIHPAPTVLVIDDNPDLIDLFRRYLADNPCRVVGAPDSRHALDLARELQPQAILLDVMMPDQDGWELLQRFKVEPETKAIPIIICSVLREEKLAQSLGASGFVAKPVTQQALKAVLTPLLTPELPRPA